MTIKTIFFDFMGTCLDWCSAVIDGLPPDIPVDQRREMALAWRVAYFIENENRRQAGLPVEDIDATLLRTLERLLASEYSSTASSFSPAAKECVIAAWHKQPAWPDVAPALEQLRKELGCELVVHANGTTRLQLDLVRSSGLKFDLLMSSQMLGQVKPAPESYLKALALVKRKVEECVMVAAHVADLRGAHAVGLQTIYIRRSTDDTHEDLNDIENEFDQVLDGMQGLPAAVKAL